MFLRIWQPRKFEPGPLNLGRFQPYLNVLALTFMAVIAVRHLLVLLLLIFKYIIGKPKARGHRAYTQGMEPHCGSSSHSTIYTHTSYLKTCTPGLDPFLSTNALFKV